MNLVLMDKKGKEKYVIVCGVVVQKVVVYEIYFPLYDNR